MRRSLTLGSVALLLLLAPMALAQAPAAPTKAGPAAAPVAPGPVGGPVAAPGAATGGPVAPTAEAAPAPAVPARAATGYAPAPVKRTKVKAPARVGTTSKGKAGKTGRAKTGHFVIQPGFEMTDTGGSRIFVELGQAVPVEERKAKGTLTFVLKGAHHSVRNNLNPLVTEHFNTPVRRARLVRTGADLHLVIELRQDVGGTQRFVSNKEGHAVLQVDFAPGTFVKDAPKPLPEDEPEEPASRGERRGGAAVDESRGTGPKP